VLELARRLRADRQLRAAIKIRLLSAKAQEADERCGYQACADDYVTNPSAPPT
jgi:CheY-like chemotaxis protein